MPYQNAEPLRVALHLYLGRHSMTATQFAEKAKLHRASVDRMLNGGSKFIPPRTAAKWAAGLDWTEEQLFSYVPTQAEVDLVLLKYGIKKGDPNVG